MSPHPTARASQTLGMLALLGVACLLTGCISVRSFAAVELDRAPPDARRFSATEFRELDWASPSARRGIRRKSLWC